MLNKQKAEIQLGQRLGYPTITQNFTSTVQQIQFLNTGTLLRLRPFVSSDGMVRMEIHPERSTGSVPPRSSSRQQNTAEMTTNVMIPDGATLVIGGLMEDERDYSQQGLPGLNRLPILGAAFGNKAKTLGKRELVVLLTPHIWRPNLPPGARRRTAGSRRWPAPACPRTPAAAAPGRRRRAARRPRGGGPLVDRQEALRLGPLLPGDLGRQPRPDHLARRRSPPGPSCGCPPRAELARATRPAAPGHRAAPAPAAEPPASAHAAAAGPDVADAAVQRSSFEVEAPPPRRGPRPMTRPSSRAARPSRAPADGGGDIYPIHVVGRFESLRSIARDRLGDSRRAAEILALNRDTLRSQRPPRARPAPPIAPGRRRRCAGGDEGHAPSGRRAPACVRPRSP